MRTLKTLAAGAIAVTALAATALTVSVVAARAQQPAAPPSQQSGQDAGQSQGPRMRGFDYWQPDWMIRELWGPGRMPKSVMARLLRHTTFVHYGVPKEYEGARSTVKPDAGTIAAGRKLYQQHCASCHSADGMGSGDAARALSPSPALLGYMINRPVAVDEYLLWSIADGGKQFETEMPAFKDAIQRDDIWRIIAFMRAGFPAEGQAPAPATGSRQK